MPKVDKWRLCWDYNKDAKAIIQSTLTNVVPFCEQMGPRVWVGKQAEYPSPSWLEKTRINGKQGHCQDSPILHVIIVWVLISVKYINFAVLTKNCLVNTTNAMVFILNTNSGLSTAVVIICTCTLIKRKRVYNVSGTSTVPLFICPSALAASLRLGRTLWLQLLNYESVKCRMLWAAAKQTDQRLQ